MRDQHGSALEVSDRAQHQDRIERTRPTPISWRRLAVFTLTLVLVSGVHVAWAPGAYAAPAEFVEQRITLDGLDADLTLERTLTDYRATLRFVDEPPSTRIQISLLQLIHGFQNPVSSLDTTWSDNLVVEDGKGTFSPATEGEQAILDLGHLCIRTFDRIEVHLNTTEEVFVTISARMVNDQGDVVDVRSAARRVLTDTVIRQRFSWLAPNLRYIQELRVETDRLVPVEIHSFSLTAATDVRISDDGAFRFQIPIAPEVAFDVSAGGGTATFALNDLVGPVTVADIPINPWDQILLVNQHGEERIYDDQPIHLSLPEGLTAQDIGKVEWYRNGIRLRFVGEDELGLTNDQMKTFDGNPWEFSPASAHTDHAIMGYEYSARIYDVDGRLQVTRRTEIRSRVTWRPEFVYANFFSHWAKFIDDYTDRQILDWLTRLKEGGINGACVDFPLFVDTPYANDVVAHHTIDEENVHEWGLVTPTDQLDRPGFHVGQLLGRHG